MVPCSGTTKIGRIFYEKKIGFHIGRVAGGHYDHRDAGEFVSGFVSRVSELLKENV